jgi:hypothetical protein
MACFGPSSPIDMPEHVQIEDILGPGKPAADEVDGAFRAVGRLVDVFRAVLEEGCNGLAIVQGHIRRR